jgi:hypothetical protein
VRDKCSLYMQPEFSESSLDMAEGIASVCPVAEIGLA